MLYRSCWAPYGDWQECQRLDAWGNWKSLKSPWATSTSQTITLLCHVGLYVGHVGVRHMFEPVLHWYGPNPAVDYLYRCCSCDMGMKEVALHRRFLTLRWAGSWALMLYWSCWPPYDNYPASWRLRKLKLLKPPWAITTRQTITLLSHVGLHVDLVGVQYMFEADPALIRLWPAWLWLILSDAIFGIPVFETQSKSAEILSQTTNNIIFCMYLLEILIKKL
jgi:hypothetical protein